MKKLMFKLLLLIILLLPFSAYAAKAECNYNKTEEYEVFSCSSLTLDNESTSCQVKIRKYFATPEKVELIIDGTNQTDLTKKNYTCAANPDIEISLNSNLENGVNSLSQLSVTFDDYYDTFRFSGIIPYKEGLISCQGADYNLIVDEEDNIVCKITLEAQENGDVLMRYGEESKINPGTELLFCSAGGDSLEFRLSKSMRNGSLKSDKDCPKIIHAGDSENDSSINDNYTPDRDTSGNSSKLDNINTDISTGKLKCESIFKGNIQKYIEKIFSIIKYAGIVLCIGLSIYDFVKALLNTDNDALSKITKRVFIRLILVAVLFMLPTLVNFVISIIDENACKINF